MKKLMTLAALAVLVATAAMAADEVRDGDSFNTPNCVRKYVRRTVDSTGTTAGRLDSAVVTCAPNVMPTPLAVGGVYAGDTTSRVLRLDSDGYLYLQDASRDRDYSLVTTVVEKSSLAGGNAFTTDQAIWFAPYTGAELLVSWNTAAAADSDSIAIAIYAYALTSTSMATANYLLSHSVNSISDTGTVCLPGGLAATLTRKLPPTVLVISPFKAATGGPNLSLRIVDVTPRLYTVPPNRYRYVQGSNAISINLGDLVGPRKAQYVGFTVANWGNTTLSNLSLKLWPKAN